MIQPIFWKDDRLLIVDQTQLPEKYSLIEIKSHSDIVAAIKKLAIRGAPAIGIAAAFGLVIGMKQYIHSSREDFFLQVNKISDTLIKTRPTANNLSWAINKINKVLENYQNLPLPKLWDKMLSEAKAIHNEDIQMCRKISDYGNTLIPQKAKILTHCNAGGLATGGFGTALGIIIRAHQSGKDVHVFVDETRPLLQGARLTAWELTEEKVPFTLCTDNMAAHIMATENLNNVIVGADRIAANGDTANKIGTYGLAVLADYHNIPFYVAAPSSTIDSGIQSGKEIIIEQRSSEEITHISGKQIAPHNCPAISPAFDITPANLITAIISEKGIHQPPYNFR